MSDYLKYNTDLIQQVVRIYDESVSSMDSMLKDMDNMVDDLRQGWKSEAGQAFFDKYNDDWLNGFVQYQEVLLHMSKNLGIANREYQSVTEKAKDLSDSY